MSSKDQISLSGGPAVGNSSGKFIAVGIDFGTTYSGVSWAFSDAPNTIYQISEWPSPYHNNHSEEQVPTQYDIASGKWGYEVSPDMDPVKWFKLLLLKDKDLRVDDIHTSEPLRQAKEQLRSRGAPTATEVVGKYLEKLWKHTYGKLASRVDIDNLPLRVAITVPAIWPPYAQKAMRMAADIAGITAERDIGATSLELVQEPEAAGLSTLFERGEFPEIQAGESFVVCDAGGGTVDIISYTVDSTRPFRLRECVNGDGKLCGAFRVDEAFEAHMLQTRLKIRSLAPSEYNMFVTEDWEMGAKRKYSGQQVPERFFMRPPGKAFHRMDRWRGRDKFWLTKEEMQRFFNNSLTGICSLVSDQCKQVTNATGKMPKKILLVGGLGDSAYIHSVLQAQFKGIVLRPLRPWSAVAHGAVLRLLHDNISAQENLNVAQREALETFPDVTSRKSRYSYGIVVRKSIHALSDFDPILDEVVLNVLGEERTLRMNWYLKKGEEVTKKSPVLLKYHQDYRYKASDKCRFSIRYCAEDEPPKRRDPTVRDLCEISCDWDKPFEEWDPIGDPSLGWRRHRGEALGMTFEGEPKWKIQVGDKKAEHDVDVEYLD